MRISGEHETTSALSRMSPQVHYFAGDDAEKLDTSSHQPAARCGRKGCALALVAAAVVGLPFAYVWTVRQRLEPSTTSVATLACTTHVTSAAHSPDPRVEPQWHSNT